MNTRPLTVLSADPAYEPPLMPAHFITGPSRMEMLHCDGSGDLNPRPRWRRLQQLSKEFWGRWLRDYLPSLQQKLKWVQPRANIQPGDVVLVVDPSAPRGRWPMGRVEQVMTGADGHVRVAAVKMRDKTVTRPVVKLVKLCVNEMLTWQSDLRSTRCCIEASIQSGGKMLRRNNLSYITRLMISCLCKI